MSHRFPSVASFSAAAPGRRTPLGDRVGSARFDGVVGVALLPRAALAALLPAELELATARDAAGPPEHPLVFMYGSQRDRDMQLGGRNVRLARGYRELAIAVPAVRRVGSDALSTFMARMFADLPLAVWSGNAFYGYAKEHVEIATHGDSWVVARPGGAALVHACASPDGEWQECAAATPPALQELCALMELPVLGRKADGRLVESRFRWELEDSRVRPVRAFVSAEWASVAGIPRDAFFSAPGACFELQGLTWRVSWPRSPRSD